MNGVPNFHHCYTFVLVLVLLFPVFSVSTNTLSAKESLTISSHNTIVSPSHIFELGFFKLPSNSGWYIGIWYKVISKTKRTYVWVANRDSPLSSPMGTPKISDNNLVILDISNTTTPVSVWSTNLTRGDIKSPVIAELLDNGFNRLLRSWRSPDDPSSGDYSFKMETKGFPQIFLWKSDSRRLYRSRPWNGVRFSDAPEMQPFNDLVLNFRVSNEEVTYSFQITKDNIYSIFTLSSKGLLERFTWNETEHNWHQFWHAPKDQCDQYKVCGSYSYCNSKKSPVCQCIKGFEPEPMYPVVWGLGNRSGGCARQTQVSCDGRDGFVQLKNIKLPDSMEASVDRRIGVKECKDRCLKDCSCTAFANRDIHRGGWGCMTWTGELVDIRSYTKTSQDLYVRVVRQAAADQDDKSKKSAKVISSSIGVSMLLVLSFIIYGFRMWKQKRSSIDFPMKEAVLSSMGHISRENKTEDLELPLMEFDAIATATDNFSDANKLGQGGFVKRLSKTSVQGNDEFMNEVRLIARLQHINLVRLLGCCVNKDEKMLIYEYLENLSFDSHLFDKTRRSNLDWKKRFDIVNDFGMARIFGRDETEANTRKVVGTYGYMSLEYAMYGKFSMKSDVFSFGVLLLEIISGKRNNSFYDSDRDLNLLSFVRIKPP
ncbi:hypothetical protein DY000_02047568 [Brassica cretica]|uniref:Non-specific serine/threonine protein kinase n=1 Tax=Brassica cretica TaxID=69181 RepID=A0ABQ7F425_BRACR|nr:hypothetical protein DY000_02047568 [Brassica cretica]